MSTTAPSAQTPQQQTHAILAAIVLILAADTAADVTATVLTSLLAPIGITAAAVRGALDLLGPLGPSGPGTAAKFTRSAEFVYRAQYILAAATRLSHGGQLAVERRYAGQHLAASRGRRGAAADADAMVAAHGPKLMWSAVMHGPPDDGCQLADGTVFAVDDPPVVDGHKCYPGQAHPNCLCTAVTAP